MGVDQRQLLGKSIAAKLSMNSILRCKTALKFRSNVRPGRWIVAGRVLFLKDGPTFAALLQTLYKSTTHRPMGQKIQF
jgi:hypothetical protein